MKTTEKLAKNVKQYRASLGWTQQQLSDRANVSTVFISEIENNKAKEISLEYVERLANAFEISLDTLTGRDMYSTDLNKKILQLRETIAKYGLEDKLDALTKLIYEPDKEKKRKIS